MRWEHTVPSLYFVEEVFTWACSVFCSRGQPIDHDMLGTSLRNIFITRILLHMTDCFVFMAETLLFDELTNISSYSTFNFSMLSLSFIFSITIS